MHADGWPLFHTRCSSMIRRDGGLGPWENHGILGYLGMVVELNVVACSWSDPSSLGVVELKK